MRLLSLKLISLLALLVLPAPSHAAADEAINDFRIKATLNSEGMLDVQEQIEYNFGAVKPHEVTRAIPTTYNDDQGTSFPMVLTLVGIEQNGAPVQIKPEISETTTRVTFPVTDTNPIQHFNLHYTLKPVVMRGYTDDVFKLNMTGLNWTIPINKATITLETPGLDADNLTCFTSIDASTSGKCEISQNGDSAVFTIHSPLLAGETLNISCSFPKGKFATYLKPPVSFLAWIIPILGVVLLLAATVPVSLLLARRSLRRHGQEARKDSREAKSATPLPSDDDQKMK